MDLNTIINRAQSRFGDSAASIYTEQEWKDYVLDRYSMIWAVHSNWPFKQGHANAEVLAGARASSVLLNGSWKVQSVRDTTNGNTLIPFARLTQINSNDPNNDSSGTPTAYLVYNNRIEVWPKPDTAICLCVDGLIEVPTLACDAEPAFPEQYHVALIEGALADAYLDDGNMEQFKVHQDRYNTVVTQMLADLLDTREENYSQIIDTWYQS